MMEGDRPTPKNVLDRLKSKAGPTVGGERMDVEVSPGPAKLTPRPRIVLDWEKRCAELEARIEEQAKQIVELKEELHAHDERIAGQERRTSW